MKSHIDLTRLTPSRLMEGNDHAETVELRGMLDRAENYLKSFAWCPPILEKYVGVGVPGVFALFLFKLQTSEDFTEQWLWVVEGDVPSAYFVIDDAAEPAAAVLVYCEIMDAWVRAVENGAELSDVFPVQAKATMENATMLRKRTEFLIERVLPTISK